MNRAFTQGISWTHALAVAAVLAACGGSQKQETMPVSPGTPNSSDMQGDAGPGAMPTGTSPSTADPTQPGGAQASGPGPEDDWVELETTDAQHRPPGADLAPEERTRVIQTNLQQSKQGLARNDADNAVNAALKVLDVDETNVDAMLLLAEGYYRKGFNDKAEYILTLAKRQRDAENNPRLWMLMGLVVDRDEDREGDALENYEKASELDQSYLAPLVNKGAIYLSRRRYDDAVTAFERAAQLQGNSVITRTNLGSAYRGKASLTTSDPTRRDELLRKAEREYKSAMSLDASYAPAYFNLGLLYLDAEPFPGMEEIARLETAQRYFNEYKRVAGSALRRGDPIDDYMAAATSAIERQRKREEARLKREERDRKRQELERKRQGEEAQGGAAPDGDGDVPEAPEEDPQ